MQVASPEDWLEAIARDRDRGAFALVFAAFAPRVKGFLVRSVGDPVRADDLTQEVLLKVWHRAHQFDRNRASASTWIFAIARNVRIDAIRREARPEADPEDPVWVGAALPQPLDEALRRERETRVQAALAELPAEQADILRRAYYDDRSLSEIGTESAVPLGTVKSRVRLAFQRLRAALLPEES